MTGSAVSGQAVSRKQEEWCTTILIGPGQEIISNCPRAKTKQKTKNKTKQKRNKTKQNKTKTKPTKKESLYLIIPLQR